MGLTTPSVLHTGLALLAAWLVWKVARFVKSGPFDNIPGPPSGHWLAGHLGTLFHRSGWSLLHEVNSQYGSVVRMEGLFKRPALYVFDPLAMHDIVVKSQNVFEENHLFLTVNRLLFGKGLLATLGEDHRKQRKLLNPVFSISHMRYMIPIFYQVTDRLRDSFMAQVSECPRTIDMLGWMTRCALELIGQGGLGHSFDRLTDDGPNVFCDDLKELGQVLLVLTAPLLIVVEMFPFLFTMGTPRFRRWVVEHVPYWRVRKTLEIIDGLHNVACAIVASKRAALEKGEEAVVHQLGAGKDIMSRLLQANMVAAEEDKLADDEVLAQVSTFIFAATDTTSGALSRIFHLLADHQEVQERARQEIIEALKESDGDNRLTYDQLSELPYLDAICRETLRLYPPLNSIGKIARQDAVLPLSEPIRGVDGSLIREVYVPNDTDVTVGILASNRNPALWGPDSDEWKPERWLNPLPQTIANARIPGVYANLMTFLGGGRACIGFKFSQMEMKIVLVTLLRSFRFSISTENKEPIVWNLGGLQYPSVGSTSTKGELPLRVELV